MIKYRLEEMSSAEIDQAVSSGITTVVVTVGSTEQHGAHLPISTDSLIADELGLQIVIRLGNALLAPTIRVGVSDHHMSFPGTISIRKETLINIITDYCLSLAGHRFTNIAVIPTHSGNCKAIEKAIEHLQTKTRETNFIGFSDLMGGFKPIFDTAAKYTIIPEIAGTHAGEAETSMVLAIRPDLVEMNKAERGYVGNLEKARSIVFKEGVEVLTKNGIFGDPTEADAKRGGAYLSNMASFFANYIKERLKTNQEKH